MIVRGPLPVPAPARILLIQPRRIGDVLLCSPSVRALAIHFPLAEIDFLAESPADEVLWGHPRITRLIVAPRTRTIGDFLRVVMSLRSRRYDWAIDFFANPRSAQFAFFSGAPVRVGLDRRGRRWAYTHRVIEEAVDRDAYAVDLRLDILRWLGVPSAGRELEIYSDQAAPEEAARAHAVCEQCSSRTMVAVATGSANPAKRYPSDLAAGVISMLLARGLGVILTSGPGETEFAHEIQRHLAQAVPHLEDAHVPTLAALYRRAQLYVGPDSGPKHIAVACSLPTVTVFGPGRPSNWNDALSPRNRILIAPCDVRPNCVEAECVQRQCLRRISPDEVVKAVESLLVQDP